MKSFPLLLALTTTIAGPAESQDFTLQSRTLGETLAVQVGLPRGYGAGAQRYPVIYLLDGPTHFEHTVATTRFMATNGLMPEMIVVSIPTSDRNRDFTTALTSDFKAPPFMRTTGGTDRYLEAIAKDLVPEIERRFRTVPHRVLIGHSLGGLVAFHAVAVRPDLFQAIVALDPSTFWDNGMLIRELPAALDKRTRPIRIAWWNGAPPDSIPFRPDPFDDSLRTIVKGKTFPAARIRTGLVRGEWHTIMPLPATWAALRALYDDWSPSGRLATLEAIESHYDKLSAAYGYPVVAPEDVLNSFGYQMLQRGKTDDAIAAFTRATERYPDSPNTHDSLGEALTSAGRGAEAKPHFERAIALAEQQGHRNLATYRARLNGRTGGPRS